MQGKKAPSFCIRIIFSFNASTFQLFTVKHLIKITPITFPNGLPDENEFEPEAAQVQFVRFMNDIPQLVKGADKLGQIRLFSIHFPDIC